MIKNLITTLALFLALDTIWLKLIAGDFFAKQLGPIGRFSADGGFDVRLGPAIAVYVLMAIAMEVFLFKNESINNLRQ